MRRFVLEADTLTVRAAGLGDPALGAQFRVQAARSASEALEPPSRWQCPHRFAVPIRNLHRPECTHHACQSGRSVHGECEHAIRTRCLPRARGPGGRSDHRRDRRAHRGHRPDLAEAASVDRGAWPRLVIQPPRRGRGPDTTRARSPALAPRSPQGADHAVPWRASAWVILREAVRIEPTRGEPGHAPVVGSDPKRDLRPRRIGASGSRHRCAGLATMRLMDRSEAWRWRVSDRPSARSEWGGRAAWNE
jgi:hypothetical protein